MINQIKSDLQASLRFLEIANRHTEMSPLLDAFVSEIQKTTHCEAVGIRVLDDAGRIPYQSYLGFTEQFYDRENLLSIDCDQCMCGNVIKGKTDPGLPIYTPRGSFHTPGFTRLLSEADKTEIGPTRNVCSHFGFESVALIPMRMNDRIIGLVHLADTRENQFAEAVIELLEWIAQQLALAVQRIRTELSLKDSEKILNQIGDNLPDGVIYRLVHTPDGRRYCSHMSQGCKKLFQVPAEDIKKDAYVLYNMFPPDEVERVERLNEESMKNLDQYNLESPFILPDGTTRWFQWHSKPSKLPDGTFIWDGVALDITRRKNAEDALQKSHEELESQIYERTRDLSKLNESLKYEIQERRKTQDNLAKSEAKYRGLIDNALIGTMTTSHEGYITFVNEAMVKMYDFDTPQQMLGHRFRRHWKDIKDRDRVLSELEHHGSVLNFEAENITHKGRHIQILFSAKKIGNELLGMFMDITDRKQAETKLQTAYSEIETLKNQLELDCTYLGEEIKFEHNHENIIGDSEAMAYVLYNIEQIAPTDTTVLVLGESGTGKELVARAIHHESKRSKRPLVKVDCATLPDHLIESELFGHRKGAFTHALEERVGRFSLADKGTIFLDEIGELPLGLQQKLLRVLQDGEYERLGSSRVRHTDTRIIAATNRDLAKDVEQGLFRKDLFYRLNVFQITLPALRDRSADIPLLINFILKKLTKRHGKKISIIPKQVMNELLSYAWPGNVRELENVIERAVIEASDQQLNLNGLSRVSDSPASPHPPKDSPMKPLSEMEKEYIFMALEKTYWKISGKKGAAELLGLNPSTLRGRMLKHNIQRPDMR